MKVAVTGHTRGIGKAIFDYFQANNNQLIGFARSNGFDIANIADRNRIVDLSKDVDIFVNNAYNSFDDSQTLLLRQLWETWKGQDKLIINVSTRNSSKTEIYALTKRKADLFAENHHHDLPHILNIKPGLTDTERVQSLQGQRMPIDDIITVIDFALAVRNKFKVHNITFGI
jgi:hypothetical protein